MDVECKVGEEDDEGEVAEDGRRKSYVVQLVVLGVMDMYTNLPGYGKRENGEIASL